MNAELFQPPPGTTMFLGTWRMADYLKVSPMKTCAKCGQTLPVGCFSRDKRVKAGVRGSCRACSARYRSHRRSVSAEKKEKSA